MKVYGLAVTGVQAEPESVYLEMSVRVDNEHYERRIVLLDQQARQALMRLLARLDSHEGTMQHEDTYWQRAI